MAGLALPRAQLLQDHHCPRARTIPRLRQTSPPHCTSTHSSNTPLGSTVRALCPTYMRRRMHTKSGTATSTSARTGNNAHEHTHSHKCTLARRTRGALTCETVGAATPWRREQRISATRASKRRPSTRCKREAKLRLDLAALRLVRVASREWGFRWAVVGDANSSTNGDTHTKYGYVGI